MATVSSKSFFGGKPAQAQPTTTPTQEPNYLQRVGGDFMQAGQGIVDTVLKGADTLANPQVTTLDKAKQLASTGVQTAGQFAGALFSPVTEAVKPALEVTGLDKPIGEAINTASNTAPVQAAIEYYKTLDPETQKNLEALYNIGTAVAGQKALNFGSTVAPGALDAAGNLATKGISATGKGMSELAPKVLPTSEGIMQRVARIPKSRQQLFEKVSGGESVGKYLETRGLFEAPDELVPKLYERFTQSRNAADEGLAKLSGTYKDATIGNALSQLLAREKAVSLPGVSSKDLTRVQQLVAKYRREGLNMSEINETKRLFERNVKLGYQRTLGMQPEKIAQATNLDTKLREWQFAKAKELGFKELADINKETQLARQLADDLGKEIAGTAGNNALGLTDAILVSGGDPAAIAMLLTKKTAGSKAVQAKIAEWLSKNKIKSSTPSTPPARPVSQLSSPKRNPNEIFPQVDETIKNGITNYAKNPQLGLATKDITKDYDTVAKALSEYDTSSPTLNLGKGNKMAAPLSEDAATLADLKAKLETGVLSKEEIVTAGRLLQKEGAFGNPLIQEAKKYPTAEEFVKAQGTPKTIKVWVKSKFSNDGAYADIPVIRKVDDVTLYQGGSSDGRQFWTSNKKYAESFGDVTEKTGSFYKVDNGNRVVDVYVEAPTKSQLTDIWNQAHPESNFSPEVMRIINMTK